MGGSIWVTFVSIDAQWVAEGAMAILRIKRILDLMAFRMLVSHIG